MKRDNFEHLRTVKPNVLFVRTPGTLLASDNQLFGTTTAVIVTVVITAEELTAALDNWEEYIEINDHLDLGLWAWKGPGRALSCCP